ncbi:hypothetical protein [Nocardioides sp. B-3]|uniref:hypothetical protein n=1 Tax=Nocardioides sp. B-3 TaxID=2895565 RepID=UPI00215349E8|nr:hypothetical protein [Nocardioides sp. B-3]UUZ58156.1 hypothetical protein LP418_18025 [Nocardioides sp. B-3]
MPTGPRSRRSAGGRLGQHAGPSAPPRVGDHADSAGPGHRGDRLGEGYGVAVDVAGSAGVQEPGERLVPVDHDAGGDHHVRDVRTTGGRGVGRTAAHGLLGDVEAERLQLGADRRHP